MSEAWLTVNDFKDKFHLDMSPATIKGYARDGLLQYRKAGSKGQYLIPSTEIHTINLIQELIQKSTLTLDDLKIIIKKEACSVQDVFHQYQKDHEFFEMHSYIEDEIETAYRAIENKKEQTSFSSKAMTEEKLNDIQESIDSIGNGLTIALTDTESAIVSRIGDEAEQIKERIIENVNTFTKQSIEDNTGNVIEKVDNQTLILQKQLEIIANFKEVTHKTTKDTFNEDLKPFLADLVQKLGERIQEENKELKDEIAALTSLLKNQEALEDELKRVKEEKNEIEAENDKIKKEKEELAEKHVALEDKIADAGFFELHKMQRTLKKEKKKK